VRSFISNSNRVRRRHVAVLLALVVAFCAAVELTTRVGYDRVSRIQRRTAAEYAAAVRAGGTGSTLLLGNSLLDDGVDLDDLRRRLGPGVRAGRFVVESSTYFDWLYGLRHLFGRGARPRTVVLVMSARQWLTTATRGEVTAGLMVDRRDLTRLAADVGLDNTKTSNLAFASVSNYYANRAEIRKWLLGRVVPGLDALSPRFAPPAPPLPSGELAGRQAGPRLTAIRDLCEGHGARLVVVVPPTGTGPEGGVDGIVEAGARAGVAVLVPVAEGRLSAEHYRDGFHLNELGRAVFTEALASQLGENLRASTWPPTAGH
jgi:hypothetical protein